MKVYTNQANMAKNAREATYQNLFMMKVLCGECASEEAMLMMIIVDDDKEVCNQPRPPKVRVWPHDSMAIALYLCTECGEITAEWNQA